jgi:hypothetical protein
MRFAGSLDVVKGFLGVSKGNHSKIVAPIAEALFLHASGIKSEQIPLMFRALAIYLTA